VPAASQIGDRFILGGPPHNSPFITRENCAAPSRSAVPSDGQKVRSTSPESLCPFAFSALPVQASFESLTGSHLYQGDVLSPLQPHTAKSRVEVAYAMN
jgi:hypothetical protein